MKVNGMFSIVRAGQLLPTPLVELALKQFPSALGTVYLEDGGLCIDHYSGKDVPSLEDFLSAQEGIKDSLKAFWFGKGDGGPIPADSMQPFSIIKKDGKDAVVALIAGDYTKWMDEEAKKAGETDIFFMVNNILRPKIAKLYTKMCSEDVEKLFEELKGSKEDRSNEADINALASHRGCVGLMFNHGDWLAYDIKNEDYVLMGDWGYSTDRLGWNPDAKPKPSVAEKAKGFLRTVVETAVKPEKNSIDKANAGDTKIPDTADTGSDRVDQLFPPRYHALKEQNGKTFIQLSKEITSKEDRGAFVDKWCKKDDKGQRPAGYKEVKSPTWIEVNQDFLDWKSGKAKSFKDMRAAGVEGVERKPVKEAPIITPEKRKTLSAYINSGEAKAKAESGQILNAEELKAASPTALFTAQMAEDVGSLEDTFRWDSEYLEEIAKRDLNALILLTMEYRHELMRLMVSESAPPKSVEAKDENTKADPPAVVKKKKFSFA